MNVFALLSFFSALVCGYLAVYAIRLNWKSPLNRAFFILSMLLAWWAFIYTFVIPAPTAENAMWWANFAGIGVSFWPAAHVHFFIVLTDVHKKFNKPIFYTLLYIPGVIIFTRYLNHGNLTVDHMIPGKWGWIEVLASNSPWFWFMNVYFLVYLVAVVVLVIFWVVKSKSKIVNRQAAIIGSALFLTVILAYGSDIVLPLLGVSTIPAIAPVFFIFWAFPLWFAIIKFKFMQFNPENVLGEIMSNVNDLIFFVGKSGRIINVNEQAASILGLSINNIITHNFSDFIREKQLIEQELNKLKNEEISIKSLEMNIINNDKKFIPVSFVSSIIKTKNKQVMGIILIGKDLRPEKHIHDLKIQSEINKLKAHFISSASHEFKTPLTNIMLASDTLERHFDKLSPKKKNIYFNSIRDAIKQITVLLDDVLILENTNTGKITFTPISIDIVKFIQDIIDNYIPSISSKHKIKFTHKDRFDDAKLDTRLLQYIISNLLSNAIKYSPKGGNIRIDLSRKDDILCIEISDEGIGIPSDNIPSLFNTFHRGKNVGDIAGTGLGLAIIKDCVDLHKGTINIKSEINKGTTFTVRLPIKQKY